jgi:hypothetical protein
MPPETGVEATRARLKKHGFPEEWASLSTGKPADTAELKKRMAAWQAAGDGAVSDVATEAPPLIPAAPPPTTPDIPAPKTPFLDASGSSGGYTAPRSFDRRDFPGLPPGETPFQPDPGAEFRRAQQTGSGLGRLDTEFKRRKIEDLTPEEFSLLEANPSEAVQAQLGLRAPLTAFELNARPMGLGETAKGAGKMALAPLEMFEELIERGVATGHQAAFNRENLRLEDFAWGLPEGEGVVGKYREDAPGWQRLLMEGAAGSVIPATFAEKAAMKGAGFLLGGGGRALLAGTRGAPGVVRKSLKKIFPDPEITEDIGVTMGDMTPVDDVVASINPQFAKTLPGEPTKGPDMGRRAANLPGVRHAAAQFNPSSVANTPAQIWGVGRAVMGDEADTLTETAMLRLRNLGSQDEIFGAIGDDGLIGMEGPLKGIAMNTIRTNRKAYIRKLNDTQKAWLDAAHDIERAKLKYLNDNGIDIKKIDYTEGGEYAGRRVVKYGASGDVVGHGFIGQKLQGKKGPGVPEGFERERAFANIEIALEEGFRYLPEDEALRLNVRAAYQKVADKRMTDWLLQQKAIKWRYSAVPDQIQNVISEARKSKKVLGDIENFVAHTLRGFKPLPSHLTKLHNKIAEADPMAAYGYRELGQAIENALSFAPDTINQALVRMPDEVYRSIKPDTTRARFMQKLRNIRILKEEKAPFQPDSDVARRPGFPVGPLGPERPKGIKKVSNKAMADWLAKEGAVRRKTSPRPRPKDVTPTELRQVLAELDADDETTNRLLTRIWTDAARHERDTYNAVYRQKRSLLKRVEAKTKEAKKEANARFTEANRTKTTAEKLRKPDYEKREHGRIVPEAVLFDPYRPTGSEFRPGEWRKAPLFEGYVFTGPDALKTAKVLEQSINPAFHRYMARSAKTAATLRGAQQANAVGRFFSLTADVSAATIHLLYLAGANPKIYGKAMKGMVQAWGNPKSKNAYLGRPENIAIAQKYPGLILSRGGTQNEFLEAVEQGGLLRHPKLKRLQALYEPFQRGFEGALDTAGIEMMKSLDHYGTTAARKMELTQFVNEFRGLTSTTRLGVGPATQYFESAVLLAPRYNRAVAALLFDLVKPMGLPGSGGGSLRGSLARRQLAQGVLAVSAMGTVISALQHLDDPENIDDAILEHLNPRSNKFMTWEMMGQNIGPGSKLRSIIRLIATTEQNPEDLLDRSMGFGDLDFIRNPLIKFARGQQAPGLRTGWDILSGADFLGEPTLPGKEALPWTEDYQPMDSVKGVLRLTNTVTENFMPYWIQSALLEGDGVDIPGRITRGAGEFLGMRTHQANKIRDLRSEWKSELNRYDDIPTDALKLREKQIEARSRGEPMPLSRSATKAGDTELSAKLFIVGKLTSPSQGNTFQNRRISEAIIKLVKDNQIDPNDISSFKKYKEERDRYEKAGVRMNVDPDYGRLMQGLERIAEAR